MTDGLPAHEPILPEGFQERLCQELKKQEVGQVMTDVCNFLDRMCHEGQWGVLDAVCRAWPTGCNPRSLQLTIGVLTATLAAKQHIPGRAVLLESAKLTWGDRPEYWGGLE